MFESFPFARLVFRLKCTRFRAVACNAMNGCGGMLRSVPVRVARIIERGAGGRRGPLTREQAEDIVRRSDRDRAGYVRYLFQKDWLDPLHHSIVINTAVIEVPAAIDLLAEMIGSDRYDATPASRQRLEQLARSSQDESARLVGGRR